MRNKGYLLFIILLVLTGAITIVTLSLSKGIPVFPPLLILLLGSLALWFMGHRKLKQYAFTLWVFAGVATAMVYPSTFDHWFGLDLKILIVPLIQVIMFGMGTTLNVDDFARVIKMPGPVFIGIFLQFLIMPSLAMALVFLFGFEPEIAAGIVLIGSCPGGVASNLMVYLAKGNVALSVTMTSCSTLLSPVMTPLLMKLLAGKMVPINFLDMMFSILNMIIVPILAGLLANAILYGKGKWKSRKDLLLGISAAGMLFAFLSLRLDPAQLGIFSAIKGGLVIGFALVGIVSLAKLIVGIFRGPVNWMDRVLPLVSMAGIVFIIAIITTRSREDLLEVGLLLIGASIVHNMAGYLLGYWSSRLFGMKEKDCRTVAFEVGMQNGGMASGLAMNVLDSAKAALAPAIFGPWMNVSGSVLATWWSGKRARIDRQEKAGR